MNDFEEWLKAAASHCEFVSGVHPKDLENGPEISSIHAFRLGVKPEKWAESLLALNGFPL